MTPNADAIKELEAIVNGWIRKSVAEQEAASK
jgi:hypothetical protein